MVIKNQDSDYCTVEVDRNLPLSEQLHRANSKLSCEVSAGERIFLEDIRFNNGYKVLRYRFWRDERIKK